MKASVCIVLIVMGVLLIATPPVSDYLYQRQVAKLLSAGASQVVLEGRMSAVYRLACWLAGVLMVGVAIAGSFTGRHSGTESTER